MKNVSKILICLMVDFVCLFNAGYFSVMLAMNKLPLRTALPAIVASLAVHFLVKRYLKYYIVHTCVSCQKNLENGQRYILVIKNEVSRACCEDCYGHLPPAARKLYQKEER